MQIDFLSSCKKQNFIVIHCDKWFFSSCYHLILHFFIIKVEQIFEFLPIQPNYCIVYDVWCLPIINAMSDCLECIQHVIIIFSYVWSNNYLVWLTWTELRDLSNVFVFVKLSKNLILSHNYLNTAFLMCP